MVYRVFEMLRLGLFFRIGAGLVSSELRLLCRVAPRNDNRGANWVCFFILPLGDGGVMSPTSVGVIYSGGPTLSGILLIGFVFSDWLMVFGGLRWGEPHPTGLTTLWRGVFWDMVAVGVGISCFPSP